jgi:NADP-dependent 3-hydroxy acid dehydrogenase YdfG
MVSSEKVKELFNVNVIGLLEVTKALLPFIRKSRGRIINISSGHGLLAIPDCCSVCGYARVFFFTHTLTIPVIRIGSKVKSNFELTILSVNFNQILTRILCLSDMIQTHYR